jgi:hypothetical protein
MTGMGITTTSEARRQILRGQRAESIELFVAGPGSILPGTLECRIAAQAGPASDTSSTGFVVFGKWVALNSFAWILL